MTSLSAEGLQAMLGEVGEKRPIPVYPAASIHTSALDIFVSYLAEYLCNATGCDKKVAYDSIQWPNEFGDLVAVLPRLRLSNTDTTQLAEDLAANFPPSPLFAQPFADDFNLRFMFSEQVLARILLPYILDRRDVYGKEPATLEDNARRSVIVEYSSPNIGRDFDGNHLRSTVTGAFISALHEGMGWKVCRMNFLGDWGKHIGLLAVGWSRYGSQERLLADPLGHLLNISSRINSDWKAAQEETKNCHQRTADGDKIDIGNQKDVFFKRMEDGDPEALELWQRFRDLSIAEYRELYAQMSVNFDDYSGESEVSRRAIDEVENALKERGIYEESEQAWIIDFAKHGHPGLGTAIVRYRNGTTSYLLRDIAAVLERHTKYSFDKMIYVVSEKQTSHFKQLFRSLELMGRKDLADRLEHVSFGKAKGLSPKPETSGLLLADILGQCQASIQNGDRSLAELCDLVGSEDGSWTPRRLGAAITMAHDLSGKRGSTFTFDPPRHATIEGNTFLYLQSSLQRTRSVLEGKTIDRHVLSNRDTNFALFEREAFVDILRHMIQFPGVVKASYRSLESSGLIAYLYRLADLLPAALADVIEGDALMEEQRIFFFQAVRHVFSNGLGLLGIA